VKLLSVDAESNGLHGQPFAIGAVFLDDHGVAATFTDRCPIAGPVDGWVEANVLPAIAHMPETSPSYETMLDDFRRWREAPTEPVPVVAHVAWPVEARLFADAYGRDPVKAFYGPYPLHDVASMLWLAGEDPLSVEDYLARHEIKPPPGSAHDPLFDAHCTALAAADLFARFGWWSTSSASRLRRSRDVP
jgi:hypothetical protein